ncbi:MAG: hypothetical protein ACRDJ5_01785, partial [Actinomycetota bacterium]
ALGYPSVGRAAPDFFDKARAWAVAVMLAAGVGGVIGSLLDWVTITPPPRGPGNVDFGREIERSRPTVPFNGIEAADGWWTLGAGLLLGVAAVLLLVRRRARYAWLGLLAAMLMGAVAIADYRAIDDLRSSLSQRMDIVGDADPALGITLVAGAALVGLIGAVAGVTATPHRETAREAP